MADIMGNISIPGFDANKLKALMEGKQESSAPPGLKPGEKPKPANTGVRKFYQKNYTLVSITSGFKIADSFLSNSYLFTWIIRFSGSRF